MSIFDWVSSIVPINQFSSIAGDIQGEAFAHLGANAYVAASKVIAADNLDRPLQKLDENRKNWLRPMAIHAGQRVDVDRALSPQQSTAFPRLQIVGRYANIGRIRSDGHGVDIIWSATGNEKWTKGWTAFVPFLLGGKPHYLAYKSGSGQVAIDRIRPDGQGVDTIWPTQGVVKFTKAGPPSSPSF